MKGMREQITSMGEKLGGKIIDGICEVSIKIGEKSRGRCSMFGAYEPKIPIELLKEENK
ncbi:cyclic lactone autoinducer peptide [Clostridium sp.]|uniref:cyclic lactone autoinducer peptide n=1 Tax=Clostridium sp. TaxID=1506 RepID=UPI002639AF3F|nr:cyclic lactone autoinducer peptide [Clostridium sp.]